MLIVGIKLKSGVTPHHLASFMKKWVPDMQQPRRIGSLSSLKMYSSAHTGVRLDEFVLAMDGFVEGPPLFGLEDLCDVVYRFECEETGSWGPKDPA